MPSDNITLYADWTINTYDVTFDANDGTLAGGEITSYTYGDAAISAPANPTRVGYDFGGWFLDDGTFLNAAFPLTPTADTTVYAKWSATIIFNENGGDTASCAANQTSSVDNVALTLNDCTRTGYEFTGWNTAPSGPGTPYADEGLYDFASDGSDTLYARWAINQYDVTFIENGGAPVSDLTNQNYGSTVTLPTPTKTGYTFDGWDDGSLPLLNAGDFTIPDSNTTLTAQWTINTFTVSASAGTGGTVSSSGGTYNYHDGPTITATPATGYAFDGWTGGGSVCTTNPVCTLTLIDANYPSLVATFTAEVYTITFDENGGDAVSNVNYTYGTTGVSLPTPTRAGFDFVGWFTDDNTFLSEATSPYAPTDDVTLHAKWVATATYTVDFNTNGGSATPAQDTSTDGASITLPSPGTKSGNVFDGWYDNVGLTGAEVGDAGDPYVPAANITLYAKWTSTGGGGGGGGGGGTSAPTNLSAPFLTGYTSVGSSITASPGTWTTATSFVYHWYRCTSASSITQVEIPANCTFITNDVGSTYIIQAADLGTWIRVRVRAQVSGATTSLFSATTAAVGAKPASIKARPPRVMNGLAAVGSTLAAKRGQWNNVGATYTYQWYRCSAVGLKNPRTVPVACVAISGANVRTYVVRAADKGSYLRVRVTATAPTGQGFRMSQTTGLVPN